MRTTKQYDKAYFDKWYRHPRHRITARDELQRKAALALSTAEYFLGRAARSALDIGCGEGAWRAPLLALRPRLRYLGIDPSEYAVSRFGARRNILLGSFAQLADLGIDQSFDLVVCSDVLHYVPDRELRAGLEDMVPMVGGLAYIEVLTAEDDIVGDLHGLIRRRAAWYRKQFTAAGLTGVGPYCWLSPQLRENVSELQRV